MNGQLKKISIIFIMIITMMLLFASSLMGYEVETHQAINKYVATTTLNGFTLDDYLKTQLGMQNGIKTSFQESGLFFSSTYIVSDWIGWGGWYEDKPVWYCPYLRSINHFINPMNDSGFSGLWGTNYFQGMPADAWALSPAGSQYCGYNSWNDVRYYYYKALTATTQADHDNYFAQTFQGLGQIMHLLEDQSVPAHVRNNQHLLDDGYEMWAKKKIGTGSGQITPSTYNPVYFIPNGNLYWNYDMNIYWIPTIPTNQQTSYNPYIQTLLFSNQYPAKGPGITVLPNIGLAEYTNANFLSPDTIFVNFPYPVPADTTSNTNETDANGNQILYLSKNAANGVEITHFARAGLLYNQLSAAQIDDATKKQYQSLTLTLDDTKIYEDYAKLLIPRAIGYSSQALSYFFRGQMEVEDMPVFDNQNQKLQELYVEIRNTTPTQETMVGDNNSSCFTLSWHYTPSDGSGDIWGRYPNCVYLEKSLPYGKDANGNDIDDEAYTTTIIFDNLDQIQGVPPILKNDFPSVEFMLTYVGNLGDETMIASNKPGYIIISGAVIGKHFQPSPIILFDEEWISAPKGDNLVWYMSSDSSGNNVDPTLCNNISNVGMASTGVNTGDGGSLIMTNVRNMLPGCNTSQNSSPSHCNVSLTGYYVQNNHNISANAYNPKDSTGNYIFPINITKSTYIELSLSDMSISPIPPASNYAQAYQILTFHFNHGYVLQFTAAGQGINLGGANYGYFAVDPGTITVGNIYTLFEQWNIPTPPQDLKLEYISISQQTLQNLPCDTEYTQNLVVDFIRVEELSPPH